MSRIKAVVAVVELICFSHISVNISLNFTSIIINNCLYYLDYAYKFLKSKLMNLGNRNLLFLLPLPCLLLCSDLFLILSVKLPVALIFLLTPYLFVYCSDTPNWLLIKKLMNFGCLELLLLAPLLPTIPNRSFSFWALVVYSVHICYICAWVVCFFVCVCCVCT